MKKIKLSFIIFSLFLLMQACNKTSILDKAPPSQYTDATLWSDVGLADYYLVDTYHALRIGITRPMLSSVSDDSYGYGSENYVTGTISPSNISPWGAAPLNPYWNDYYSDIQKINVFISKIDGVVDAYPESQQVTIKAKTDVMKGEALFLRAFCYAQLLRLYGGVPLIKDPLGLGQDFTTIERGSFEESVNFVSADCDAAAALLLKKSEMSAGRATMEAALALKSRVLLFAASDLTADGTAKSKYVGYEHPDRTTLWTSAKNAAKAVMDVGTNQLANFGAPDKVAVAQNYFNFFKAKDLSNSEIIWGKMYSVASGDQNLMNQWNGANSWDLLDQGGWGYNAPSQNLVDAYQMEDGSNFFDHFSVDGDGFYHNVSAKYHSENPYYYRDPRFYGSILYDSAVWAKRTGALAVTDPLGIYDKRTRVVTNGGTTSTTYGLDSRQSIINNFNASFTGYVMKKMLDNDIIQTSKINDNVWIEFRYAEIILNYAEACLGLGQTTEAETYINMIRNRAGMPNYTGDITQALRYERRIELVFENSRWFDIRRWKILEEALTNSLGIIITETKTNGSSTTTWQQFVAQKRGPITTKMYWLPILSTELAKAPQLVQNPDY